MQYALPLKRGVSNVSGMPQTRVETGGYMMRMDSLDTDSIAYIVDRGSLAS